MSLLSLFRRAPAPPPPRSYSDGWRDCQAHIVAYLEGYAVSLRATAQGRNAPGLATNAAAVDAAITHIRAMEEGEP
jgi:hypothetical protein